MSNLQFFPPSAGLSLAAIAEATGARLAGSVSPETLICQVAPLELAGAGDLTFLENTAYAKFAPGTGANACFLVERQAALLPAHCAALISNEPYRAFAKAAGLLFPSAVRPQSIFGMAGVAPGAFVHPEAKLESGVHIDHGAVIGPGAEICRGWRQHHA
jgi:UDP-3-O-[3-hydroxymyristoyl] glucosamine N-acyltransferase